MNLNIESNLKSDCAPLNSMILKILESGADVKFMRDPTRGGLAAVLNEIAISHDLNVELDEGSLLINDGVDAISELLGLDPLHMANEGKVVVFASAKDADKIVDIMKEHPFGKEASKIGRVTSENRGMVTIRTEFGTRRILDWPKSDPLPRIC